MPSQTIQRILTINTGSSSLKVALYKVDREGTRLLLSEVTRIGIAGSRLRMTDARGVTLVDQGEEF